MFRREPLFTLCLLPRHTVTVALLGSALGVLGACSHQETPPATPATPAATPAGSTAAPAAPTVTTTGASVFVVHEVSDFDGFKKYFEDGSAAREQNGVKGYLLSRLDDGRVAIHFFADDADKIQAALNSARMQEYLNRKGAPDASLVWVTRNVIVSMPSAAPTGETFSLYLKLHVADFEAFRRAFEESSASFAELGVLAYGLHQSTVKDDVVILHFVGNARDKLAALPSQPKLVELLKLAKPDSTVNPIVARDVARSRAN